MATISRRSFVKAALGSAALFLPEAVAAEPERRVWHFPTNPLAKPFPPDGNDPWWRTDEAWEYLAEQPGSLIGEARRLQEGILETGWFDSSMLSRDPDNAFSRFVREQMNDVADRYAQATAHYWTHVWHGDEATTWPGW